MQDEWVLKKRVPLGGREIKPVEIVGCEVDEAGIRGTCPCEGQGGFLKIF